MKWLQYRRRAPGRLALRTIGIWTFSHKLFLLFFRICYRVRLVGRDRVPERGPVILVANHQSHFDPLLVGLITNDRPMTSMARRSLFKNPVANVILRLYGGQPIERGEGDIGAMKVLISELKAGRVVLVFPEGTRTFDGRTAPLKRGIRLLIKRSNATVLPIGIDGAFDAWPRRSARPNLRGRIGVRCGEPVAAEALLAMPEGEMLDHLRRTLETLRLESRGALLRSGGRRFLPSGPADDAFWNDNDDDTSAAD